MPVGLVAALGFHDLAAQSLWSDEAYSVGVARLDWPTLRAVILTRDPNMSLYHALLHYWVRLGSDEFTVRAFSTLAAIATIVPFYFLGRRLLGRGPALAAALLLAVNGFLIQYAQEARSYALLCLLTVLSALLLLRALETNSRNAWVGYVVVTVLAIYAHAFAIFSVAAQAAALLSPRARPVAWRQVLTSQAAVATLAIPLVLGMRGVASEYDVFAWLEPPTGRDVGLLFGALGGLGGYTRAALYLGLCALSLFGAWAARRDPQGNRALWHREFLLLWLVGPVLVTIGYSLLVSPIFQARYLIGVLPPLVLLAVDGALRLRPVAAAGMLVLLLALCGRGLVRLYGQMPKQDWRAAAAFVLGSAEPGDGIVFSPPYARRSFEYYLPVGTDERVSELQPVLPSAPWGAYDFLSPELRVKLRAWLALHPDLPPRLWLVGWGSRRMQATDVVAWLPEGMRDRYCPIRRREFVGPVVATLYAACGPSDGPVR